MEHRTPLRLTTAIAALSWTYPGPPGKASRKGQPGMSIVLQSRGICLHTVWKLEVQTSAVCSSKMSNTSVESVEELVVL